ncbi:MAG: DUF2520 domain-containing protein [Actinomycetaceae bacterium]|nr:DUF2520 domain-containing protein [Actinomycetaceae bacterium]MDU0969641.1 DUF2520 domain-containing protein [Actinomycetaceae bacterium]
MTPPGRLKQGLIGREDAATALAAALDRCGHDLVAASIRDDDDAEHLDALVPGVTFATPAEVAAQVDLVWLAEGEGDLSVVAAHLAEAGALRPGQLVAHATAGVGIAALADAAAAGATVMSLVPLIALDGTGRDISRLSLAPIAVSAAAPFLPIAQALAVEVGGEPIPIIDAQAPLVAQALRLVTDHMAGLIDAASRLLSAAGVDDPGVGVARAARESVDLALAGALRPKPLSPDELRRWTAALDRIRVGALDTLDPAAPTDDLADVAALVDALEGYVPDRSEPR